jgi:hypothetical protein
MDGKNVSMIAIHYLHLDRTRERLTAGCQGVRMQKEARITTLVQVFPFQLQYIVLVLLHGTKYSGRKSCTDNDSVPHGPGAGSTVHIYPTAQILTVEKVNEVCRGANSCANASQE